MQGEPQHFMEIALTLAERGRGWVEPNPLVGAVVVAQGKVVGTGWHQRFGEAHAEVNALAAAGAAARGATLYVTLEPCCHHGKTPPCVDAIIKAGVAKVVAAVRDPFPQVAGGGFAQLQSAGVEVEVGVGAAAARRQNAPYFKLLRTGRPWVIAKWAMTLDGKIATATGESKWITGEQARRRVHEVRGRMDGIAVGIGTVLADDPLLTARPPGPRVATRIVLDRLARLPMQSRLVRTARQAPVLLFTSGNAPIEKVADLLSTGCDALNLDECESGVDLQQVFDLLGQRRFTNVLIEGGASVLGSAFAAQLVDEVHVYIAPKGIGGRAAPGPVGGVGVAELAKAWTVTDPTLEHLGEDLLWRGLVRYPDDPTSDWPETQPDHAAQTA
jgi:diaminohydroxyphosphoribosylaminopyrimidine deaminase/5-amino-6-(5-phosphoribosylamino)uracil reductase